MTNRSKIPTLCRMCDHGCGMEVTVEDGRPVSIEGNRNHPFNKGWLCVKGRTALDFFNSPQRLTSPLIRKDGQLVPASWDEALTFAAENLLRLKERYGPQCLAIYQGEGVGHQEIKSYMKRFANVYGTPNFMSVGSICNAARTLAEKLTFGGLTKPDVPNTRLLIVWGGNPLVSHEVVTPGEIHKLKKRGGTIVVVDPRKTETASLAHYHLAPKPGRDEILILNMLHVILKEQLWDKAFTDAWVDGFDSFFETVSREEFSPENGEELTGVTSDLVRKVARLYARTKPACIFTGNGLEHQSFGIQTVRLLAIMKAITGNLDVPGGELFTPRPNLVDITAPLEQPSAPAAGSERFPLLCQARREAHALCLADAVLDEHPYAIKGAIIGGGNSSLEWPDSGRIRAALQSLEFLMVIDVVFSPDCHYAHVVLPACTFLERDEIKVNVYHNLPYITLRTQVVEPVHGVPDQMIWVKLTEYMGFGDFFPWKSCKEGIDYQLSRLGLTYDDLRAKGGIHQYDQRRYTKYQDKGFQTPTGKVEIQPKPLKDLGVDASPVRNSLLDEAHRVDRFPLILTTGGNLLGYLHWQYRYIPRLRKMSPEPIVEIHPRTAAKYGISENEMVEVACERGAIKLKARLTSRIRPDTIHVPQGWTEANVNEITSMEQADPISGFPNLKSLRCTIKRV